MKVFYEPRLLVDKLAALGWQADVHLIGWRFFYATATGQRVRLIRTIAAGLAAAR